MHTKIYTRPFLLLLGVLVLFGFNDPKENDTPNNDSSIIQKESSSYFKKVLRDFKIEIAKTVSLNSSESEAKVYAMMGIIPPINMEIIPAGSYIINMGVEPQTKNNALKPYGLIWELLHDHLVPIKWAINADKIKDGVDFTYNNVDYKGGPFIVLAEYRSIAVNTVISTWEAQGVIGVTTTLDFIAPIDRTINYSMNWTLDHENGDIAKEYLDAAGIPGSAYNWVLPKDLNCCNDVFLMPHADPTWNSHKQLLYWNDNPSNGGCSGAIWAGCKAVSELENIFNPSNPSEKLNFLMLDAIAPTTNSAVWSDDHNDGEEPYSYAYHYDPIMQFIGLLDGSQENGAEQIYLPTNSWRPSTRIGIWEDDHENVPSLSPGPAAKLAFGYAFGNTARGYVSYQAAHKLNKGNKPENIAAQRAFLNFSFRAVEDKAIKPLSVVPQNMTSGASYNLSASATGGSGNYIFEWTSSCGGFFSNPFSSVTTFIAPSVAEETECIIKLIVTDDCGTRTGFNSIKITVTDGPSPPIASDDNETTAPCNPVTINAIINDYDPNNDPLTLSLVGNTDTGNGIFTNNNDGTVTYTPNIGFSGSDVITYQICDTTALCDNATITVSVGSNTAPIAIDDYQETQINTPITIDVLANDSDPDGGNLNIAIQSSPTNGSVVVENGMTLYTPDVDFIGTDQFIYQLCDESCIPLCDLATVSIDVGCNSILGEINILGKVFLDEDSDGILGGGEEGQGDVTVKLYKDENIDGQVDVGDTFVESKSTNSNGGYQFTLNSIPNPQVTGSVSIPSTKGAFTYEGKENENHGDCDYLVIENYTAYNARSFVEFDLSSIDPSCTIVSVDLILTHHNSSGWGEGGDPFQFGVHQITSAWVEGTKCEMPQSGSLTWNNEPSYSGTAIDTETGGAADADGDEYSFNVTSLVEDWLDGSAVNYGIALIPTLNTGDDYFAVYPDGHPYGPRLEITATCATGQTTITSTKGTYGYEKTPNRNSGACENLEISLDNNEVLFSFIEFDFGSISSNCTISNASLELTRGNTGQGGSFGFDIHRVTQPWDEGIGNQCEEQNSDTPGLTWNERVDGTAWTTPGGDYAATVYASGTGGDDDPTGTKYTFE